MKKWLVVLAVASLGMSVVAEESAEWQEATFDKLDRNKDGKVTRSEYVSYHKERATKDRKKFDSGRCEERFRKMDQNRNNSLTKEEFMAGNVDKKTKKKSGEDKS